MPHRGSCARGGDDRMNKESALANLGLSGTEDTSTVARVYGERLSVVQDDLIKAQTDDERGACRTKLAQLVESYERDNRQFSIDEVTDIARQLIDALRYAHRYIVHRDIKPENIWLADDGTVKLMDFGIARAYSSVHMTQTGMTLGTAYYMAPEQRVAAKDVDWRADQYALGVVLYELLSGTLPTGAVKPLETERRDLPKRYARALMRAMSPKPDDRFASLADLLAEMEGPERKVAVGIGGLLLIAAGVAAAGVGAYYFIKPAATPAAIISSPPI